MAKDYSSLIEPKKFKYKDSSYHIGKIPVFYAQRLLLAAGDSLKELDLSLLPEAVILELLSYCAVDNENGVPVVLDNIDIINMMVTDPKMLMTIELKVVEENFGFFFDGSLREVFLPIIDMISKNAQASTPSAAT